ncbi:MAG: 23S rRNA (pseudouridine(1915)-N(3))-methyltransferase RlmH [Methylocystaceae bacterium]
MRWQIISVGRVREKFYREGTDEYLKRLKPYVPAELVEGLEEKIEPTASPAQVEHALSREKERILNYVHEDDLLVVLDERGKEMTSKEWATWLQSLEATGRSRISFVIGAANGLHGDLKQRADYKISLSRMTFLHQMAVLVLTEQLYRAVKIQRGEPYHR